MRAVTVFAWTLWACAFATAQMSVPFGLTGKTVLLAMNEVKKEVRLTKEQSRQIEALFKDGQRDPNSLGATMDMHYMTKSLDKKVVALLDGSQNIRLQQLFLQANGMVALSEPEVASGLRLSDETLAQVKALIKAFDKAQMSAMMDVQKTRKIDQKKLDGLRAQAEADISALLSQEQRDAWKAMLGEPFKFPKARR
jgi:hypothetical protein